MAEGVLDAAMLPECVARASQIVSKLVGCVLDWLHDMGRVACMLLVAGCSVVARRWHSIAGCLEAICCLLLEL